MKNYDLQIHKNPLQTKADLVKALRQICEPLHVRFSHGAAHLHVGNISAGFPDPVVEFEGFSRLLWGITPLLAGGGEYDQWETMLHGIKNGTNPEHQEYWGDIHDFDQRIVEMAAYGLGLSLIPEHIWDPLNEQEKHNLVNWLSQINYRKVYDSNWLLFVVIVHTGLKNVGASYDQKKIESSLDRIDDYYISDGWYSDGVNAHCDYYSSFAIHYYCLLYAKLMEADDPKRSKLYKERAALFAQDFIYWFSNDGSALPFGRSLTYRFAQAAFWSAMIYAEVEAFPYGQMKGIVLKHLRWWFKLPIFHADGTLSVGYAYPNLLMGENYNSSGSPYWGLKTFLLLVLKEDHPFWQAEEMGLPSLKSVSVQHPPHLVIYRQEATNHVLAFNSGHPTTNDHTHTSAKYEKFVYSNYFGFSVPRAEWGLEQGAYDSMLALSEQDNLYRVKRKVEAYEIDENVIYTEWKPWQDVVVKTWLIVGIPWHIRVHQIQTKRLLDIADGGFALGKTDDGFQEENLQVINEETALRAKNSLGETGAKNIYGYEKSVLIHPNANTNLIHSRTVIPTLTASVDIGTSYFVSAFLGEPGQSESSDSWQSQPYVELNNHTLKIFSEDQKTVIFEKTFTNV